MPADFLIGTDEAGKPVHLPDAIRREHVTIIGATGTGKTTLLERLILADIENQTSCVLIDAHGDLTRGILCKVPAASTDRVHVVEPWFDRPFGLNLLDVPDRTNPHVVDKAASELLLVFKRMFEGEAEFRPQLDNDLDLILRTLLVNEECTLAEAPLLLWDDPFYRRRLAVKLTNEALIDSMRDFDTAFARPVDKAQRIAPLRNRLNPFLVPETIRSIVGQAKTTVPLQETMDTPGRALLISLPTGSGGGSESQSKFLGNLFTCLLTRMIFDRVGTLEPMRNRVHLYLDEYGRYATPATARLFGEGRKYNFSLIVAHQARVDIEGTSNETAELQAGSLICFHPSSGKDAEELASSMPVTPRPAEEAPRAISQAPVQQLLEGKHESRFAQGFAFKFLHSLTEDPKGYIGSHDRKQMTEGMELLNTLLVDVMKGDLDIASSDFSTRSAEVAYKCRSFVGLSYRTSLLTIWNWDQWAAALVRRIVRRDPEPCHDPDIQDRIKKQYETDLREFLYVEGAHDWYAERKEIIRNETNLAYPFFVDLIRLCELLQREPVYVSIPGHTGRPQQTYADARAELADQIKRLPKYHAYVRLRTGDGIYVHRVRMAEPASEVRDDFMGFVSEDPIDYGDEIETAISVYRAVPEYINARSFQTLGVPRKVVDQQIAQRRRGHLDDDEDGSGQPARKPNGGGQPPASSASSRLSAPPPPRPTIGRRSPKRE
ncbi:type IV secretory system conjugative DNA transfer family protein [Streptomyces sp. M41]|uniref:type IV secretory system conjugative DNA transfer family protein n=1 Tax=Streptomyces sp. M41 TaxID=3059412 RepID=UPI00374CF708